MAENAAPEDDFFEYEQDFRRALISLSEAFLVKGVKVRPFHEKTWEQFRTLAIEKKREIYRDFSRYYEIYMPVLLEPGSPNEDGKLLWAALKKLNLRPSPDFFSRVDEGDVVEIYAHSRLQIFHNINFFEICSYTFLEVFSFPYTRLWLRDPEAVESTARAGAECFAGKFTDQSDPGLPIQYLMEAFSEDQYIVQVKIRFFSPFYDDKGQIVAVAVVSRCRVLGEEEYDRILQENLTLPRLNSRSRIKLV